jgi:hypothetical protein
MIYTYVLNHRPKAVRSPLDRQPLLEMNQKSALLVWGALFIFLY